MNALARIMIFGSLIGLLSSVSASGEYRKPILGASFGGGLSLPLGDLADNSLYDARFGGILSFEGTIYYSNSVGLGFGVSVDRFKVGGASELHSEGISNLQIIDWETVSVTLFLNAKKRLQPYLKFNIGASEMRFKIGDHSTKSGASIAAGASAGVLYIFTSKDIGVFGEISYRHSKAKYGDLGSRGHSTPRARVKMGTVLFAPGP